MSHHTRIRGAGDRRRGARAKEKNQRVSRVERPALSWSEPAFDIWTTRRPGFRVDEVAMMLCKSKRHVYRLVEDGILFIFGSSKEPRDRESARTHRGITITTASLRDYMRGIRANPEPRVA